MPIITPTSSNGSSWYPTIVYQHDEKLHPVITAIMKNGDDVKALSNAIQDFNAGKTNTIIGNENFSGEEKTVTLNKVGHMSVTAADKSHNTLPTLAVQFNRPNCLAYLVAHQKKLDLSAGDFMKAITLTQSNPKLLKLIQANPENQAAYDKELGVKPAPLKSGR